jgi:hypothetical protein
VTRDLNVSWDEARSISSLEADSVGANCARRERVSRVGEPHISK